MRNSIPFWVRLVIFGEDDLFIDSINPTNPTFYEDKGRCEEETIAEYLTENLGLGLESLNKLIKNSCK